MSAMAEIPSRTYEQRTQALALANATRMQRAGLKREIHEKRVLVSDLLGQPMPAWLENARVFDLLMAIPFYGRTKTHQLLGSVRISTSKTMGGLTERQRNELIYRLGQR